MFNKTRTNKLLDLIHGAQNEDITTLLKTIHFIYRDNVMTTDALTSDLVFKDYFSEIKRLSCESDVEFMISNSLKELQCIITDEYNRDHSFAIQCKEGKFLVVKSSLPYSNLQKVYYSSLDELVSALREYVRSLSSYLFELEHIDRTCCIVEPVKPTFKDDYRKILIANRIWLHVEVTPTGAATNISLVGTNSFYQEKLSKGLLNWDYDKNIVENIMEMFDLEEFPGATQTVLPETTDQNNVECGICLCSVLPGDVALPQPLCSNTKCGSYFHVGCLYQWLVSCNGGVVPKFNIAKGECPHCLQPISCWQK